MNYYTTSASDNTACSGTLTANWSSPAWETTTAASTYFYCGGGGTTSNRSFGSVQDGYLTITCPAAGPVRFVNSFEDQLMRIQGKREVNGKLKRINIALRPGEEIEIEGLITLAPGQSFYTLEPLDETAIDRRRRLARARYHQKHEAEIRRRAEAQAEIKRQEANLRREKANKRAEDLLAEYIGIEAFGQLHEIGYIEVDSRRYAGQKYRIPKHHYSDIEIMDAEGRVIDTLCLQLKLDCPGDDVVLARWILANFDEETLLSVGNHHGARERSRYEVAAN